MARCKLALLALAAASLGAGPALAGDVDAGVYTGIVFPGTNHELYEPADTLQKPMSPGPALGLRLSYRPMDLLAGEGQAHVAANSVRDSGGAVLYAYRAQGLLFPPIELPAELEPFLLAGLGNIGVASASDVLGSDQDWAAHIGVGSRLPLTDVLGLRVDLNYLFADDNPAAPGPGGHTELLVGLNYRLTPEGDTDGDGVVDNKDGCVDQAETVNGWMDEDGCPDELATAVLRILDTEGVPAEGISVFADGREVGRTGPDGVLRVEGLMPQSSVVLRGEHFHMERPEEASFELVEGANDSALTMEWKPGRVRVVTRAEGKPMGNATASFTGPKEVPTSGVADGDQIFFLSPGAWQILVTADTYGTELVNLSIGPDERSLIVIEMAMEPAKVKVTREEVQILTQILFESGSTAIQGASDDLMREVTATVLANPHIKRIQIQGHTDSQGPAAFNRKLSQGRVDAVMQRMVEAGVSADRLEARGFGEDQPTADNNTEEGRAKNRRVVFSILEQDLEVEE